VSWHADSSLEDFSSIAVLNLHIPAAAAGTGSAPLHEGLRRKTSAAGVGEPPPEGARPFRIALRCV
jgi:hypothetical protein